MTRPDLQPTRVPANPSDSVLMTLARAAMSPGSAEVSWPSLDLNDATQRDFGDYELLEEIGRGGMGVVYRARQRSLDRDVAIKFIASGLADSFYVARFLAEARAAARLMHPNIVPVHEVGSIDGVHYFSMPLIRGRTLATLLERERMTTHDLLALLLRLCEAVDYAHRLGLLHLDLKPANVLLNERDEPLITDFGLARHMDASGGVDAQEVSGTPSFMAPEQILIKQYRLSVATDIYALGALLYRCLAQVSPHGEGEPDELIRRAAAGRIRPPREIDASISPDLAAICMHCLELHPNERYRSVAELANDLRRVRDGLPVSVRSIGRIERAQRWIRREPKFAATVALALSVLLAGMAATLWQWHLAQNARVLAESERDRAELAQELGAVMFVTAAQPPTAPAPSTDEMARLSAAMVAWLEKRLPDDETTQAEVLIEFMRRLDQHHQFYAEQLVQAVSRDMGGDYRRRLVDALLSGQHPHRQMLASILTWRDERDAADPTRLRAIAMMAQASSPNDPDVLRVIAQYCPTRTIKAAACLVPNAGRRLTELEPDNAFHWLLRLAETPVAQRAEVLHQAALREHFDDHQMRLQFELTDAITNAGVAVPPTLARTADLLSPGEDPIESTAGAEASDLPVATLRVVRDLCLPDPLTLLSPDVRADCLTVATRMMHSRSSVHSVLVGIWTGYPLARGTALGDEMRRTAFRWRFIVESLATLPKLQQRVLSREDADAHGEFEGFARRLEQLGLPSSPPSDWRPKDPAAVPPGMLEGS